MTDWSRIEYDIRKATGSAFRISEHLPVAGGCIHRALSLTGPAGRYFIKLNDTSWADAFAAEAEGLDAIAASRSIRTPAVVCCGSDGRSSWLVLEWLNLGGQQSPERLGLGLGLALAAMHEVCGSGYGWHRDNMIGGLPQRNAALGSWADFWCHQRLGVQLEFAAARGLTSVVAHRDAIFTRAQELLIHHEPAPSLLHGDLWSGNAAYDAAGTPVVFDPAVYYGDAEVDIAMTALFGGFPPSFYAAYRRVHPPTPGHAVRRDLYNLYHVLNHANLFGGGYVTQAETMIRDLLY